MNGAKVLCRDGEPTGAPRNQHSNFGGNPPCYSGGIPPIGHCDRSKKRFRRSARTKRCLVRTRGNSRLAGPLREELVKGGLPLAAVREHNRPSRHRIVRRVLASQQQVRGHAELDSLRGPGPERPNQLQLLMSSHPINADKPVDGRLDVRLIAGETRHVTTSSQEQANDVSGTCRPSLCQKMFAMKTIRKRRTRWTEHTD
jgi:hypothetical protein